MAVQTPTRQIEDLIALTERLTALLAQDAAALEARRPQDLPGRAEEVGKLARQYRHESGRIRQNPSLLEGAPVNLRAALVRATEAFDAVLARHGRSVEACLTITEGLVKAIAQEVGRQRGETANYGPGAKAAIPASAAVAITLNRRA